MGLGKTVQLLALEALRREDGPRPPTLIVCPLSVLGNWQREIRAVHAGADRPGLPRRRAGARRPARPRAHHVPVGHPRHRGARPAALGPDRARRGAAGEERATGTARALRQLPARHRVALTGTPVENRLTDLWSIMDFLNPDLLGPASLFRARYSVPVERYGDEDAAARLRQVIRPLVLRRLKTDDAVITDLPEKLERVQWCNAHHGAGDAVPGRGGRDLRQAPRAPARKQAQGARALRDDEAQAGLQPSGAPARRRLTVATAGRASSIGSRRSSTLRWPRATGRWCSPSSPGSARCCNRTCAGASASRSASCTAARPRAPATDGRAVPGRVRAPACSCCR